jgi:hypothetical protein
MGSAQYVAVLSRMIFDEPAVYGLIQTLQSHCLRHGIQVRWGSTPATPSFQALIDRHYVPFCREAILSCLAVGFVAYRLRRAGHVLVPEALPLGTFAWTVCPSAKRASKVARVKRSDGEEPPLLIYDVTTSYCNNDDIYIFDYVSPQGTLLCFSPLATLIPLYNALVSVREIDVRAMDLNAKPCVVLEEQVLFFFNNCYS